MEEDTDNTDIHKRKDVNSELEEILRHIADLDKRRALFNARG